MDSVDSDGESDQVTNIQQDINDLSPKQQKVLSRWLSHESLANDGSTTHRQLAAYVTGDVDADQIREYLSDRLPEFMVPDAITVVDSIPRLANGKIDFAALPDPNQKTSEDTESVVLPSTTAEETLATIWQELLHTDLISVHDNFFEIGGDSIISIQVVSRAREAGLNLQPQDLAKHPTIAGLAKVATDVNAKTANNEIVTGDAPTTPIQSWFLSRDLVAPHHWNQTRLLQVPTTVSNEAIEQATNYCLSRHDALRSTFSRRDENWVQSISPEQPKSSLERLSFPSPDANIVDPVVAQLHDKFDLSQGPLIKFVLLQFADNSPRRLLIVAHHLVIDHVSWSILLNDFTRHVQGEVSQDNQTIGKTTSMMTWMQHLKQYSASEQCRSTLGYWTEIPEGTRFDLPVDHEQTRPPDESSAETIQTSLDVTLTEQLLTKTNDAYNTRVNDIVYTAIAQTLLGWLEAPRLRVDLELHGRESISPEIDLSNTIGWFTSFFPITVGLSDPKDPGTSIKQIKEQLRAIPRQGIDYGVLRYLCDDDSVRMAIQNIQPAKVLINYLGVTSKTTSDRDWNLLENDSRMDRSRFNSRSHWLEINSGIWDGRLSVLWTFSNAIHRRETIDQLAQDFQSQITGLIEHCQNPDAGGKTPTDFPESGLSQDELDELLGELE